MLVEIEYNFQGYINIFHFIGFEFASNLHDAQLTIDSAESVNSPQPIFW